MITCCKGCVPPKRNRTCHATCPDYIREKAESDKERTERNKHTATQCGLYGQRSDAIRKVVRNRRKKG